MPNLSQPFPVSPAQIADFENNGHILLRTVASTDEVRFFQPIIRLVSHMHNTEKRMLEERDTYGKAFLQTTNLWRHDEQVKEFVFARRFARIAADLLGVENVRLYHDQALYKEPGGGRTPWHQDQYYWPLDTDKSVTIWMPLVDINADMGMIAFASGSHKEGQVENTAISDKSESFFSDYVQTQGFQVSSPSSMKAGDATFHRGWTIHNASGNNSPTLTREVMTIIYFADGARVTTPQNENQEADRVAWLGSLPAGEIAASEINPVLS